MVGLLFDKNLSELVHTIGVYLCDYFHDFTKFIAFVIAIFCEHINFSCSNTTLDAATQVGIFLVGCGCGSMNSCLFLLLCLQGSDDVEMDDIQ